MFSDIPCICIPIINNPSKHPSENVLVGLFLSFIDGTDTYINFSHPDSKLFSGNILDIKLHPKSIVLNKKILLYLGIDFGMDLNSFMRYYVDDVVKVDSFYSKTIEHYLYQMKYSNIVSEIIPLSKWIEFCKSVVGVVGRYFKPDVISDKCISYCNDYTRAFYEIEKNSILVDNKIKYQNYHWNTATTRPSNAWDSFNFGALNKTDGTRDKIHTRFDGGKLVQFDYDAFHIKLLAKILEYKFEYHPYLQLKEELNLNDSYQDVKTKIFQNIYGGISNEFISHPFFLSIQAMIDELYDQYTRVGYIESWFYGKRFRDIDGIGPNKLFNYFLQSLETEYNVQKIMEILKILDNKRSVLAIYLYDAFIFDIAPGEEYLIELLQKLFETDNMTMKITSGVTFGNMV